MKTITIKFSIGRAVEVGILLESLELKTLSTWTDEGFLDGTCIFSVLKLNSSNNAITPLLQLEKLRERSFIKIVNQ